MGYELFRKSLNLAKQFGYIYQAEMDMLYSITRGLPLNPLVINIGAGAGTSGLLFIETREDLTLHTVDINGVPSPFGGLYNEYMAMKDAGYEGQLNVRWFQHLGDSKEIGRTWETPADLIFIDGDHSYEGCIGDLLAWSPHVKRDGLLAIHDYRKHENAPNEDGRMKPWPGVDRAVKEFTEANPEFLTYKWVDTLLILARE